MTEAPLSFLLEFLGLDIGIVDPTASKELTGGKLSPAFARVSVRRSLPGDAGKNRADRSDKYAYRWLE